MLIVLSFCAATLPTRAQEIYRVSWTLQETDGRLQQKLAAELLDSLNFRLTRENPEAQTVRLDDRLRITVTGLYDPLTDRISERIVSIQAGHLVFREDPGEFLDSVVVDSLLRRNYFWTEEEIEPLDGNLIPEYYSTTRIADDRRLPPSYDDVFLKDRMESRLSLTDSRYYFPNGLRVIAGFGFEEVGLPFLSYRRLRVGIEQSAFRTWYEAPVGPDAGTILGGPNAAAHGAGFSFEHSFLGGNAIFSNVHHPYGLESDTGYMLNKGATLYGTLPLLWFSPLKGWLRIKAGGGLLEQTRLLRDSTGAYAADASELIPRLFIRGEFRSVRSDGGLMRTGALQIFGETISVSWFERLTDQFGITLGGTVRGLFGEPRPFEPRSTLWLSPVIFLK